MKIRECIEKFGVYYQRSGHQPMMGRLLAYLMVAEPPHKSFEEITESLLSSKSAVSNTLNMLIYMGIVDYVKMSGDRRRYFRLHPDAWDRLLQAPVNEIGQLKSLVGEVMQLRSGKDPEANRKIGQFYRLLEIFEKQFPVIVEQWKKEINKNNR